KLGDQVATIVVAGHETTATALFWTAYLLARHQGEQERVAAEVLRLAPSPENAAAILPQLTYTRAVIDEALRLYPPAFVVVRRPPPDLRRRAVCPHGAGACRGDHGAGLPDRIGAAPPGLPGRARDDPARFSPSVRVAAAPGKREQCPVRLSRRRVPLFLPR